MVTIVLTVEHYRTSDRGKYSGLRRHLHNIQEVGDAGKIGIGGLHARFAPAQ